MNEEATKVFSSEIPHKIKEAYKRYRQVSAQHGNDSNKSRAYWHFFCATCENEDRIPAEIADLYRPAFV